MAAYTAIASGDWNVATNFSPTGIPTAADSLVIGVFTITVPLGYSATIGALTMTGSAVGSRSALTINGDLTLSANATLNNYNTLTFGPGSTLDINGNSVLYTATNVGRNEIISTAISTNRAKIISTLGGGDIRRSAADVAMRGNFEFIDCYDLGTINFGDNFNAGDDLYIRYNVFHNCLLPDLGGYRHGDHDLIIEYNDFRDGAGAVNICILSSRLSAAGSSLGAASFKNNSYKQTGSTRNAVFEYEADISGSRFDDVRVSMVQAPGARISNATLHYMKTVANVGTFSTGSVMDGSLVYSPKDNPHPFDKEDCPRTYINSVSEHTYLDGYTDDGEVYIFPQSDTCNVYGNLHLEGKSGVFTNALGVPNKSGTYNVYHNTVVGNYDNAYPIAFRTETSGLVTGTLNIHSNNFVNLAVGTGIGFLMTDLPGDDQITFMDNNNWENVASPYNTVTSATKTPGVTVGYGGNDLTVTSNFVDPTRNLATWDAALGSGTGTAVAAIAYMVDGLNGYDSATKTQIPANIKPETVTDIVDWYKAGFAPTNILLKDAGFDAVTIGAIEYVAGLSVPVLRRRMEY